VAQSGTDGQVRFEQMERELGELRSRLAQIESNQATRQAPIASRRRHRRATSRDDSPIASHAVSRRRLFGLLGGAAAVGTGLAVAGSALVADPAGATTGGDLIIDGSAATNSGVETTYLTTSGAGGGGAGTSFNNCALQVQSTATNTGGIVAYAAGTGTGVTGLSFGGTGVGGSDDTGFGMQGTTDTGTGGSFFAESSGVGVLADSTSGIGLHAGSGTGNSGQFDAPSAGSTGTHLLLSPSGTSGPPTGTGHTLGQFWVDSAGKLFQCVVAGSPGVWVSLSSPLVQIAPARIYDSRVGQLPSTGPKTPITTGTTVNLDVTNNASGVPATASAVLGNLTVTNSGNGFLTVYATGATPPATSNINLVPGVTLANNFTSKVGTGNKIAVTCGGPGPTDFIVDLFGYYA
jgi:hypothetical protein